MMQGDSYLIPFEISIDGQKADGFSFDEIEVILNNIRKTLTDGEITYNRSTGCFLFPLLQRESLSLKNGQNVLQIRVKTRDGEVLGELLESIEVDRSLSKVVL